MRLIFVCSLRVIAALSRLAAVQREAADDDDGVHAAGALDGGNEFRQVGVVTVDEAVEWRGWLHSFLVVLKRTTDQLNQT